MKVRVEPKPLHEPLAGGTPGATVMVAPARGFYGTPGLGADQVRIAYVLNEHDLGLAVEVLAAGLEEYARTRGRHPESAETTRPRDAGDFLLPQGT